MSSRAPSTPYLPDGLPLPYYARPDLAYIEGQYFPSASPGFTWGIQAPAGALEKVLYGVWTFVTSAVVSNRTPFIRYIDPTGAVMWVVTSPQTIPAGTTTSITFQSQPGQPYFAGNTHVLYIPPTLILPTAQLNLNILNMDAGDQFTGIHYDRELIPTGPEPDSGFAPAPAVRLT